MLKQGLQQKLLQKLSPQQIQLMKLLQVPTVLLEQRIKEELEQNPALEEGREYEDIDNPESSSSDDYDENEKFEDDENFEKTEEDINLEDYYNEDDDSYKTYSNNSSPDEERREIPMAQGQSFHEHLMSQITLRNLNEREQIIAGYIVGNIDDDGYLRRELSSIQDDIAFNQNLEVSPEEITRVLREVQDCEPAGIGARDLQECLLIQLRKNPSHEPSVLNARKIIEFQFDEFTKKHYDKIQRKLGIEDDELKEAIAEILHLNPKPGNSFESVTKNIQAITPDFILDNVDGELHLSLNAKNAPQLRISPKYAEMLKTYSQTKAYKETAIFVKQKLDAAKWFIDAIKQRQETLMGVMRAIMEYQYEYFIEGDETKLKPMILKDIADIVGLDISTVSRVANSKYIQTHFGTKLLKDFFSESLSTDSGEEVSTREVKKILTELIGGENKKKPLTDELLTDILQQKGYNIARRTVAKYREQLDIPVARLRKEL
jgi:RNA polymerase sigma-54 factor